MDYLVPAATLEPGKVYLILCMHRPCAVQYVKDSLYWYDREGHRTDYLVQDWQGAVYELPVIPSSEGTASIQPSPVRFTPEQVHANVTRIQRAMAAVSDEWIRIGDLYITKNPIAKRQMSYARPFWRYSKRKWTVC